MNNTEYAVIGGDGRMAVLAKMLERDGGCKLFLNGASPAPDKSELHGVRATVLPVPCSFDGVHLSEEGNDVFFENMRKAVSGI